MGMYHSMVIIVNNIALHFWAMLALRILEHPGMLPPQGLCTGWPCAWKNFIHMYTSLYPPLTSFFIY